MRRLALLLILFPALAWGQDIPQPVAESLDYADEISIYRPSLADETGAADEDAYLRADLSLLGDLLTSMFPELDGSGNATISGTLTAAAFETTGPYAVQLGNDTTEVDAAGELAIDKRYSLLEVGDSTGTPRHVGIPGIATTAVDREITPEEACRSLHLFVTAAAAVTLPYGSLVAPGCGATVQATANHVASVCPRTADQIQRFGETAETAGVCIDSDGLAAGEIQLLWTGSLWADRGQRGGAWDTGTGATYDACATCPDATAGADLLCEDAEEVDALCNWTSTAAPFDFAATRSGTGFTCADGGDQVIEIGNGSATSRYSTITATGDLYWTLWVNVVSDDDAASTSQNIASIYSSAAAASVATLAYVPTTNTYRIVWKNSSAANVIVDLATGVTNNTWHRFDLHWVAGQADAGVTAKWNGTPVSLTGEDDSTLAGDVNRHYLWSTTTKTVQADNIKLDATAEPGACP